MSTQPASLLNACFRTGSLFRLKEWTTLDRKENQWLGELAELEEIYGLFVPDEASPYLTAKIAYLDTALLFYHFQQHNRVPHSFRNRTGNDLQRALAQMVLDRILEVEWNGQFLSGSDAVRIIHVANPYPAEAPSSYLSTLSIQAASYAFLLKKKDVRSLAQWLYTCHTLPADGYADLHLPTDKALYHYLVSESAGQLEAISTAWRFAPPQKGFQWFSWNRTDAYHSTALPTFKLYISPQPRHLPAVFGKVVSAFATHDAFCFKAGASKAGILRPDKLLVYFSSKAALLKMAAALQPMLDKVPVHGVPFTSQLSESGILSWGVDPAPIDVVEAVEGGSWRTMVTEQLAVALSIARHHHTAWQDALPFVTAKLQASGIDIAHWAPTEHFD